MSTVDACDLTEDIESIEVLSGVAVVEITRIVEEDWNACFPSMPVKVSLRQMDGGRVKGLSPGDRVTMHVKFPKGYEVGDLLHVHLPASLSWVHGGAKVKSFSLDFEGEDELTCPLVVTEGLNGR